ncbi:hypothetical protein LTR37_016002 [Vermiconidia calcicola]|uniref:Uncharacterized protein n=1 Tax=Vermiconidia calcicola TaxID=1690605 RepID=A0ACC3MP40_9PEZI|nr:hypothetical protein LTR37_016002 [Vermiconidia calcicola]
MSEEQSVSRKERKAQRDAERQKKGKKRKHEETEDEEQSQQPGEVEKDFLPLDAGADGAEPMNVASNAASSAATQKRKKRKKSNTEGATPNGEAEEAVLDADADGAKPVNGALNAASSAATQKRKQRKKSKAEAATPNGETEEAAEATDKKTKSRFILFVGNLPYDTTDDSLQTHFKKLASFNLRHRTDPKTKKSKGFAFLEFENYDRMKTCLKLYHHSMFDPAKADGEIEVVDEEPVREFKKGKKGGRRINVELTAGGGGKTEGRKEKIKQKNVRLDEQRQRRAEFERNEREKAKGETKGAQNNGVKKKPKVDAAGGGEDHTAGMHPSRVARLTG